MQDYTGMKINRWAVLEKAGRDKHGKQLYLCECECGTRRIKTFYGAKSSVSCGCYTREVQSLLRKGKPSPARGVFGESSLQQLFARYRGRAKEKGLEFGLTKEFLRTTTQQNCFYCGSEPSSRLDTNETYGYYMYNGLDRLDSSVGYIESNVVPCCTRCNQAKNSQTFEEFLLRIEKIYERKDSCRSFLQDRLQGNESKQQ